MKRVISTERIPIKLWLDELSEKTLQQAKNLANLPFAFRHVALMPDAHEGFGMPIGGVLATQGAVIPNAVGVDIGCGMCAVRTGLNEISRKQLELITRLIRSRIPLGFKHHKQIQDEAWMPAGYRVDQLPVIRQEYESALHQVGTLGGGNHFIEIQKASDGFLWVMLHSGSRNLGKMVADYYNRLAIKMNAQWHATVEKSKELAFLPLDTPEASAYLDEMNYCVDFAFANRRHMMEAIRIIVGEVMNRDPGFGSMINIAHNYASFEHHFGQQVLVHRKGATSASAGETGIIPGSQGTRSYIVEGLGNPESFRSCSHGAGRRLGRRQAQRELKLEHEVRLMEEQGIIHQLRSQKDLDEAAGAYKSISQVMAGQHDLVKVLKELRPMAVVKG